MIRDPGSLHTLGTLQERLATGAPSWRDRAPAFGRPLRCLQLVVASMDSRWITAMTPRTDTNEPGRCCTPVDTGSAPSQATDSPGHFGHALQASDHTTAGVERGPRRRTGVPLTGIGPLRPSAPCSTPQPRVHLGRSRPTRSRVPHAPGHAIEHLNAAKGAATRKRLVDRTNLHDLHQVELLRGAAPHLVNGVYGFVHENPSRSNGTSETHAGSQERWQGNRPGQPACERSCEIPETCVVRLITQRQRTPS